MHETTAAIQSLPDGADLIAWIVDLAVERKYTFLLAHLDDGVLWGRIDGSSLKLSGEAFPEVAVKLRKTTLQQVRLFSATGECLIWRTGTPAGFMARYIDEDGEPPAKDDPKRYDGTYLLWGKGEKSNQDFTLMQEGQQGFLHAVPTQAEGKKAFLQVRHYIQYDADGQAYISHSRLVDVKVR